jgi:hypothetical protein
VLPRWVQRTTLCRRRCRRRHPSPPRGHGDLGREERLLAKLALGNIEENLVVDAVDGEHAGGGVRVLGDHLIVGPRPGVRAPPEVAPALQSGILTRTAVGIDGRRGQRLIRSLTPRGRGRLRRRSLGERERRDGEGGQDRQPPETGR